jgi:hypothetical protein
MNWLKKEWADISPQLKYEVYRWIVIGSGGAVITLAALFMKTIRRVPEPLFYGILLLVACFCFWVLSNRFGKRYGARQKSAPAPPPAIVQTETTIENRLGELAKDIFAFLRQRGEEKMPSLGYIVKVHDGFMLYLYGRVEKITYELGASGIIEFELSELLRKNANGFSYDAIKQIAESLLKVKNKMELNSYKTSTLTKADIDSMTSAELKERMNDEEFRNQVDALLNFRRSV